MSLKEQTRGFLRYLRDNKQVRDRIAAPPHKTILYSGKFTENAFKELDQYRRSGKVGDFVTLHDVLNQIPGYGGHVSLFSNVSAIESNVPWHPDGFAIWRTLSGIFASNARGHVFFYIGSGIVKEEKVFAATEVHVLNRNHAIDAVSRDVIRYLKNCVDAGENAIGFGYLPIKNNN
jgi:hypothetical protein